MNIFNISFLIILLISSYTDIKKRIISNKLMILSTILGIILDIVYSKEIYILIAVILFIIFLFSPIKGGGDIKLLSVSAMYLHNKLSSFFFYLGLICLMIVLYNKSKKEKITSVPLAPYTLIAFLIIFFQS